MFENVYSISQKIDETITRRLGCLLTGHSIEENFPELQRILPQPIIPSLSDNPKHSRLSSLQYDHQLLQEWKEMASLLHLVNQDRIRLRDLNFELLTLIHKGSISSTDFGAFLAKTQQINYEILKKSLEKEREKNEKLLKKLEEKSLKKENSTQTEEKKENVTGINLQKIDMLGLSFHDALTPMSCRGHSRMGSDISMCSWQSTDSLENSTLNTSTFSTRASTVELSSKLPRNANKGAKRSSCIQIGSKIGKPKN
ncbi:unnamed protein product [Blepharisma stoltei]|uniref:Uncharacterized protein n=1 Tax=Blepharisma stoltei TaxID=1481888 RepID=A0AAU9IW76_9CILI|nr:unnamed protein product [Blepharisma stoltei]